MRSKLVLASLVLVGSSMAADEGMWTFTASRGRLRARRMV